LISFNPSTSYLLYQQSRQEVACGCGWPGLGDIETSVTEDSYPKCGEKLQPAPGKAFSWSEPAYQQDGCITTTGEYSPAACIPLQVGEFKLQLSNIRVTQFNASSDEARFQIQMEEFTLWITQVVHLYSPQRMSYALPTALFHATS
jgi:hypothetical protein